MNLRSGINTFVCGSRRLMSSNKLDCYQQQFSSIFAEEKKKVKYQLSNKKKRIHIFQMNSFSRTVPPNNKSEKKNQDR